MIAGILFVLALMLLATQLMAQGRTGAWPSITLASELGIPADRVLSDWAILDRPMQFVLNDIQLWIVLLFLAALIYWVTDWTGETVHRLRFARRAPTGSQIPPEPQAPSETAEPLALPQERSAGRGESL
jgi:hypothetical protein